jgi:hypothetical protein
VFPRLLKRKASRSKIRLLHKKYGTLLVVDVAAFKDFFVSTYYRSILPDLHLLVVCMYVCDTFLLL